MNSKIVIVVASIVAVAAIATGVVLYLDNRNPAATEDNPDSRGSTEVLDPNIDVQANEKAKVIDRDAQDLMENDPAAARIKYLEAADAYEEAGNIAKTAEMHANAATAEALVPTEEELVEPPVVQMDVIPQSE